MRLRPPPLRHVVVAVAVAATLAATVTPATSQPATEPASDPATDPATIGDDRVAPQLLGVVVTSPTYDAALARWQGTAAQVQQAQATYQAAVAALVELDAQVVRLERSVTSSAERGAAAQRRIDELQGSIEEIAVTTYVHGGPQLDASQTVDWEDATERQSRRALTDAIVERQVLALARAVADRDRADREHERSSVLLASTRARQAEATFVRDSSLTAAFLLSARLTEEARAVADARLTAWVDGADFQFVALDAYVKAADAFALLAPDCRLRWEVLAGIGRTEGRHGTWLGSELDPTGRVTREIIGIPLDGTNDTAEVRDSDGGALDGDAVHDRAVGPMQFLPSSWRIFGLDGNGDAEADPQNLYDAAMAAGALLCRSASGLDQDAGLRQALLRYNASEEYARVVAATVRAYDELALAPEL